MWLTIIGIVVMIILGLFFSYCDESGMPLLIVIIIIGVSFWRNPDIYDSFFYNFNKNYKIEFEDSNIYVTMKSPSIGIAGVNRISFDGFEPADIEETIFKMIRHRDYDGDYDVYVTLEFKDKYGNYYDSSTSVKVCTLNGEDVKKYADYSYFRGEIPLEKAYPWNYNYSE